MPTKAILEIQLEETRRQLKLARKLGRKITVLQRIIDTALYIIHRLIGDVGRFDQIRAAIGRVEIPSGRNNPFFDNPVAGFFDESDSDNDSVIIALRDLV